jgi:glycosyltransferase involved in cell wall biosynthesis
MITQLRVGIPIVGGKGWFGGVSLIELHVKSIALLPENERPQLSLIITDETLHNLECYSPFIHKFDRIIYLGSNLSTAQSIINAPLLHCVSQDDLFENIDFYFPVCFNVMPDRPAASWIPDFQHKYLPDLFAPQEIAARDDLCRRIAEQSRFIFCSSRAVEKDFWLFHPDSKAITSVLALRVSPANDWYAGNPSAVQEQYGLPERFVLCSNQFWVHKNHRRLFEAIALLRRAGEDVHLACTGFTHDYRNPGYVEELLRYIDELGIADLVHILGLVPRSDQIQLIRRSLFVIQPSLFEGLSLIVQECRALGKSIVLSDIDILMEYEYGIYFNRTDPQDLAQKISDLLAISCAGPDLRREQEAKIQAAGLVLNYAKEFCKFTQKVHTISTHNISVVTERPDNNPEQQAITIATSLSTSGDNLIQQQAIASWFRLGFRAVSFNTPQEISALQPVFPEVEFIPVAQNSAALSLNSILNYLTQYGTAVCGIVEADVYLSNDALFAHIAKETANCLLYGQRIDVEGIDTPGGPAISGLGYLFFDQTIISCYPQEEFCIGLPWWDYWIILIALIKNIPVKKTMSPLAYHVVHANQYTIDDWVALGTTLAKYAQPSFNLTADTISTYHQILTETLDKRSTDIAIPLNC